MLFNNRSQLHSHNISTISTHSSATSLRSSSLVPCIQVAVERKITHEPVDVNPIFAIFLPTSATCEFIVQQKHNCLPFGHFVLRRKNFFATVLEAIGFEPGPAKLACTLLASDTSNSISKKCQHMQRVSISNAKTVKFL